MLAPGSEAELSATEGAGDEGRVIVVERDDGVGGRADEVSDGRVEGEGDGFGILNGGVVDGGDDEIGGGCAGGEGDGGRERGVVGAGGGGTGDVELGGDRGSGGSGAGPLKTPGLDGSPAEASVAVTVMVGGSLSLRVTVALDGDPMA